MKEGLERMGSFLVMDLRTEGGGGLLEKPKGISLMVEEVIESS